MQSKRIVENEEEVKGFMLRRRRLMKMIEKEKKLLLRGERKNKMKHISLLKLKKKRDVVHTEFKKKEEKLVNLSRRIEELRNVEKDYLSRINKAENDLIIDEDLIYF